MLIKVSPIARDRYTMHKEAILAQILEDKITEVKMINTIYKFRYVVHTSIKKLYQKR